MSDQNLGINMSKVGWGYLANIEDTLLLKSLAITISLYILEVVTTYHATSNFQDVLSQRMAERLGYNSQTIFTLTKDLFRFLCSTMLAFSNADNLNIFSPKEAKDILNALNIYVQAVARPLWGMEWSEEIGIQIDIWNDLLLRLEDATNNNK